MNTVCMLLGYAFTLEDALPAPERDLLQQARCDEIFIDTVDDLKARFEKREAALRALEPGYTLIVPRLSRLGASLEELVEIVSQLRSKEAGLYAVAEDLDTRTQNGSLIFRAVQALGSFHSEQVERYAALARRRSGSPQATHAGGPEAHSNRGRPRALSEEDLHLAQDLIARSVPIKQICETIGVSRATFYRYLSPEGERRTYGQNARPNASLSSPAGGDPDAEVEDGAERSNADA